MDPHAAELARASLDAYAEVLGPKYDAIRARLVGALASNDVTIEDMRYREAQLRHNFALVHDFMGELPRGKNGIEAPDAHSARQVQANVLWINVAYGSTGSERHGEYRPFYTIGAKPADAEKYEYGRTAATDLLLFPATTDSHETLRYATVWDDQLAATVGQAQRLMGVSFEPVELRRMFNRDTGNLNIGSRTPGSMTTRLSDSYVLAIQPRFRDAQKVIATKGMAIKTSSSGIYGSKINTISDTTLGQYDVFTHLNRLAIAFGKVDLLRHLLERRAEQAGEDPIEVRYEDMAASEALKEVEAATPLVEPQD